MARGDRLNLRRAGTGIAVVAAGLLLQGGTSALAQARAVPLQFAKQSSSATVSGQIKGDAMVDYKVRAAAGQTMSVTLKGSNPQNYFNVLPPGARDVAMYVAQDGGGYQGVLPTDGEYTVRVYLMRPAARRNEISNYTLTVGVSGKALPPLSASKDALIPGTPYHASAQVACTPSVDPTPQQCEAFVIRRGFDGTATVEVRGPNAALRRILFVEGKPVASDSMEPMTSLRTGDVTRVKLGTDETVDIPDALVRGG